MEEAFIGLGSNQGAPVANLREAALELDDLPGTRVVFVSHVYESEPWGVPDQPPFANAVVEIRTRLRADQLLGHLKDIEERMGRTPAGRYGPRPIDLDILLFGDEEWETEDLVIPHPRLGERDFVLTPLLTIAPHVRWPDGTPIRRSGRLVGRVRADHGRLQDVDPDWYVWEARDVAFAEPTPEGEAPPPWDSGDAWVEVARGSARGAEIDILESKLRSAGIPYELSHRERGDAIGTLAGPARIMVPEPRVREAREVLGARGPMPRWEQLGPRPERPVWFRGTLRVFGWMFAAYWVARLVAWIARDYGVGP